MYQTWMTEEDYYSIPEELRAVAMLCCLIVPEEYEEEAAQVLERYEPDLDGEISAGQKDALVKERMEKGIENLEKDSGGFTAEITAEKDGYVFFSVPYDKGFSAQVNGEPVEIMKTNGMMAVRVEAGKNQIRFTYRNYDLMAGMFCTVLGVVFLGFYILNGSKNKDQNGYVMT